MNYYEVLRVPDNADDRTIRSAFRRLARRYHPDVGTGSSPEKFRELAEAYETLIDPLRRAKYDRTLSNLSRPALSRVEPPRAAPVTYSTRNYATSRGPFWRSPLESFQLIEELFRAMEDDFFFGWPGSR